MGRQGNWQEDGYSLRLGEGFNHTEGVEYVVDVFTEAGEEAAYFKFNHWTYHPDHGEIIHVMEAEVFSDHRRKGIATAVYNLIEETLSLKIHKEPGQQTDLAKNFWKNRK